MQTTLTHGLVWHVLLDLLDGAATVGDHPLIYGDPPAEPPHLLEDLLEVGDQHPDLLQRLAPGGVGLREPRVVGEVQEAPVQLEGATRHAVTDPWHVAAEAFSSCSPERQDVAYLGCSPKDEDGKEDEYRVAVNVSPFVLILVRVLIRVVAGTILLLHLLVVL